MRATMYTVPCSHDLLNSIKVPLGLVIQPMASVKSNEVCNMFVNAMLTVFIYVCTVCAFKSVISQFIIVLLYIILCSNNCYWSITVNKDQSDVVVVRRTWIPSPDLWTVVDNSTVLSVNSVVKVCTALSIKYSQTSVTFSEHFWCWPVQFPLWSDMCLKPKFDAIA